MSGVLPSLAASGSTPFRTKKSNNPENKSLRVHMYGQAFDCMCGKCYKSQYATQLKLRSILKALNRPQ